MHLAVRFAGVALVLGAALPAQAQESGSEWSPFQTPQSPETAAQPQTPQQSPLDTFEFNGIMRLGDELRISVYDSKEDKNYWLKRGGSNELGLEWLRYDESGQKVLIAMGGFRKELALKKVQIEPLKIASQPDEPTPADPTITTVTPPSATPSNVSQESDEEVRERMRRVAEEIRRRRAERRARLEERRENADGN